ncbi:lipoprotein-releasing ABC transporter permease subunit [Pseudoalteromonas luteoviolacea]|uniref:lipoprotein-releasing ABC transporter permease subunit n=1 Tax=Pseudoalteromonas luteoviolacea TaxID=43657 RepID=UPI001B373D21|nr:lipoprotein-releasing ABC transporter permease subunit [Pseudoalteromonas luteoviolacea]MBQ4809871.1 lipoprotein-releasing ABC transporter permease subunit [Pseudoalteromonas luteoviolacea]
MFQSVSLFVGLRYSRSSKGNAFVSFISFFSIAGIALGLMSLITVNSVMNGFEQSLKNAMLDLIPHVQLSRKTAEQPQINAEQFKVLPGVQRVTPYVTSDVILQTNKELVGVRLQGAFKGYPSSISKHVESGSVKSFDDSRYQLALSRFLANKLDVRLGSKVRVIFPDITSYTPLGRVPKQRLFTVAIIYNSASEADTSLAFADGASLMKLLKKKPNEYDLSITLEDAFSVAQFKQANHALLSQYKYQDWQVQQGALFAAVAMEKRVMSLLLALIVIVAVFNIVSALSMMVSEKQGEVAILQTLGFTPSKIAQVFMVQGLYNGVVGTAIGSILGVALAANINEVLSLVGLSLLGGMSLPVKFDPVSLSFIIFTSLLLSFLATLYPAKKAAKVMPAEVLRYE